MSFASHKFHGPKGVGALFARRGLRFRPLIIGGPQERDRAGERKMYLASSAWAGRRNWLPGI